MNACLEIALSILALLGAMLLSVFYFLEAIFWALVPRYFKRRDVKDQIVLITGGGSGIGRLMALMFAERGARVVTWDINTAGNEETCKMVREKKGSCQAYTVDVCDKDVVYKTALDVKKEIGKVDILINNAGIVSGGNFIDLPDERIRKCFDVNTLSHFWTTKAFLPAMMEENKGHVVTIASLAGKCGANKLTDYCASKYAAVGFDESLRLELLVEGYDGIYTTVVCPFFIDTGMFDGVKSSLLPILQPSYAAKEIVDAVLMRYREIILPSYCYMLLLLKIIFPVKAYYPVLKAVGVTDSMNFFIGHQNKSK